MGRSKAPVQTLVRRRQPARQIRNPAGRLRSSEPSLFPSGWSCCARNPPRGCAHHSDRGSAAVGRGGNEAAELPFKKLGEGNRRAIL